jgi:hypothetical protein
MIFMEAILVKPKNKKELKELKEFVKDKGMLANFVAEKEQQLFAGTKMIAVAKTHKKYSNKKTDEIIGLLMQEDNTAYGKKK